MTTRASIRFLFQKPLFFLKLSVHPGAPRPSEEAKHAPPTSGTRGPRMPPHIGPSTPSPRPFFTSPRLFTRRKHPWRLNQPTPPPRFFQFRVNVQAAKNPDIRGPPPPDLAAMGRGGCGGVPFVRVPKTSPGKRSGVRSFFSKLLGFLCKKHHGFCLAYGRFPGGFCTCKKRPTC